MITHETTYYRPFIEEFFTETVQEHDTWLDGANAKAAHILVEMADVQPGDTVVDVGCGTGLATRLMAQQAGPAGNVIGIDVVPKMVEFARSKDPDGATYCLTPGDVFPFGTDSVDVVTFGQSLPYLIDPRNSLLDAYRITKPQGTCLLACRQRSRVTPAQELFFSLIRNMEEHHPVRIPRLTAERATFGEPRALKEMLRKAGFQTVTMSHSEIQYSAKDFDEWIEIMQGMGPYPYALLRGLGKATKDALAERMENKMVEYGEHGLAITIGFTFARSVKLHPGTQMS